VSSTVAIEMEFVVDALPVELIGMNSAMMCNYIRWGANQLLLSLGCGRRYKIRNPFEWMEMISLQGKTNFFKKQVGEYSKSKVGIDRADQSFALNTSFGDERNDENVQLKYIFLKKHYPLHHMYW
jgi:ribonucleotide reductase beta subunit family protein with ferritin-like domain